MVRSSTHRRVIVSLLAFFVGLLGLGAGCDRGELAGARLRGNLTAGERDFIDSFNPVPRAVTDLAFTLFPEQSNAGQAFALLDYDPNFVVEGEGFVTVTFVREVAIYRNTLGYFTYTYDSENNLQILDRQLVFPNASFDPAEDVGYGGGQLFTGDTVTLRDSEGRFRNFTPGTRIGFFLISDGWRDGSVLGWDPQNPTIPSLDPAQNADFTSSNGAIGGVFTTIDAINPEVSRGRSDISRHFGVVRIPGSGEASDFLGGDDFYILTTEDLDRDVINTDFGLSSDNDFNDQIFIVHAPAPGGISIPNVPTPCQKQGNVIVIDKTPPELQCGTSATVTTSSLGGACSVSQAVSATASDNCDYRISLSCEPTDLVLSSAGSMTSTCTATDGSRNPSSCSVSLTLIDDTAPAVVLGTPSGTPSDTSFCNDAPVEIPFTVSDNCGCSGYTVTASEGTVAFDSTTGSGTVTLASSTQTGAVPVIVTVSDCAGNQTQATLTVDLVTCDQGTTTGDPHLISFDGLMFEFHDLGDYVLATNSAGLIVQARQEAWPGAPWFSYNSAAAVQLGTTRINVNYHANPPLSIDGRLTYLPVGAQRQLPGGVVRRTRDTHYEIQAASGERVNIELWRDNLEVRVQPVLGGSPLVGLLGLADGDIQNDLRSRDGRVLPETPTFEQFRHEFGDSWRVKPEESLFDAPRNTTSDPGTDINPYGLQAKRPLAVSDLPASLRQPAEAACRAQGIAHAAILDACVLDVSASGDLLMAAQFAHVRPPKAVLHFADSAAQQ